MVQAVNSIRGKGPAEWQRCGGVSVVKLAPAGLGDHALPVMVLFPGRHMRRCRRLGNGSGAFSSFEF
jgi:hypothetical protein